MLLYEGNHQQVIVMLISYLMINIINKPDIFNQLFNYMNNNKLLCLEQYGFRPGH